MNKTAKPAKTAKEWKMTLLAAYSAHQPLEPIIEAIVEQGKWWGLNIANAIVGHEAAMFVAGISNRIMGHESEPAGSGGE